MLRIQDFVTTLKTKHPGVKFFNGCISKHENCVGVYARGSAQPITAIGAESSYNILPITLLIHWGENSDACEVVANEIYCGLANSIDTINNRRVIQVQLLESCPTNIGRDDNNICEMTIRANIFYERR
jgi:hypothetical protein